MKGNELNLAPVIVFAFNRPDLLERCLASLSACNLSHKTDLIAYIDGPRNELDKIKTIECKNIINEIGVKFKSTKIIISDLNKGLAVSLVSGITESFDFYESVIVIEDDLVFSKYFIEYMNSQLDFYKYDLKVGSISGFSTITKYQDGYFNYFHQRPCSWGWATWKNRWQRGIWALEKRNLLDSIKMRFKFNQGGQDLYRMLRSQEKGKINSWAIRWAYTHFENRWIVSYPTQSLVENIGFRDDGTHCKGRNPFPCDMYKGKNVTELRFNTNLNLNKLLVSQANYYHSNIYKLMFKLGLV